jgi:ABC-type antimicrobial peptide transport system permease subunit
VWVKVFDADDVQAIANVIRDAGFETYSLNDMLESVKQQSAQIQGMLAAIGVVAMLVSAICIANTMMMSINERTKEIGVLKVLGSELMDITLTFLMEAFLVGVMGGMFGLCLSFVLQRLIPVLFAQMDVRSIIPFWLSVGGVAFSGIVALLSALMRRFRPCVSRRLKRFVRNEEVGYEKSDCSVIASDNSSVLLRKCAGTYDNG